MQPTPSPRKRATSKKSSSRKRRPSTRKPDLPAGSDDSTPSPPTEPSALGLVGDPFRPPGKDAPPAARRRDLDAPAFEEPPPVPLEWNPEKAETVLRGLGLLFHQLDPLGSSPHGDDLWKMTEDDLRAIAPPASRIANRYSTARAVAGYSDEAGVLLGSAPYVKRNLAQRGRVKAIDAAERARQDDQHRSRYQPGPSEPEGRQESQPEQPARRPPERQPESPPEPRRVSQPDPDPVVVDLGAEEEQNPHPGDDWFDHWGEGPPAPLPFDVERG